MKRKGKKDETKEGQRRGRNVELQNRRARELTLVVSEEGRQDG